MTCLSVAKVFTKKILNSTVRSLTPQQATQAHAYAHHSMHYAPHTPSHSHTHSHHSHHYHTYPPSFHGPINPTNLHSHDLTRHTSLICANPTNTRPHHHDNRFSLLPTNHPPPHPSQPPLLVILNLPLRRSQSSSPRQPQTPSPNQITLSPVLQTTAPSQHPSHSFVPLMPTTTTAEPNMEVRPEPVRLKILHCHRI
jgi:hypothetical protein